MEVMLICQVIELSPTEAQRRVFARNAAAARIARNDLIAEWREEGRRVPGFRRRLAELRPVLNARKYRERPWFLEVSQNAVKGGYKDAEDAIGRYYSRHSRKPRFRGKESPRRFRADNGVGTVKLEGRSLMLPSKCGGAVRTKEGLRWSGRPIRECRIRERGGRWYASVRVEITEAEYGKTCGSGVVGIDLGLETLATVACEGGVVEKVQGPAPLRRSLRTLRRRQREMSRRRPGGRNRAKSKLRVQRAHCRVTNVRQDFLHNLSDRVAGSASVIVLEDLSLRSWQRRWGRKASDLAPAELVRQLVYKSRWRGGDVVFAPRDFPSSRKCSCCGLVGQRLELWERRWTCAGCGTQHDRDTNAALNLQRYGRELPGCGPRSPCETSVVEAVGVEVGMEVSPEISAY